MLMPAVCLVAHHYRLLLLLLGTGVVQVLHYELLIPLLLLLLSLLLLLFRLLFPLLFHLSCLNVFAILAAHCLFNI